MLKGRYVGQEVFCVVNRTIGAKWYVEFSAPVEATKAIKAGAIEIVEKLRSFGRRRSLGVDQFIESPAVPVEQPFVVAHFNVQLESLLNLSVEINKVRVDVIQEGLYGLQP